MPAAAVSSLPDPYQSAASSIQSRPQPSNKRRFRGAGSRWPAAARREVLQFPWRPPRWRWVFELAEAGAREGRSGGHHLRAEQASAACAPLPPSRTSGVCDAAAARAGLLESWCACLWWCPLGVGENWAAGLRRRDEEEAVHVRTPGFLTPLSVCPQPRSRRALVAAVAGKCSPGPSLPSPPLASEARSGSAAHRLTKLHQFFFLPVGIICRSWAGKMDDHLFEDAFNVTTRIDPDGKKVDRVNRIEAKSEQLNMYMHLYVATDVYPMHVGHKFTMVLAPTLNDGTPDTGFYTQAGWKILAGKHDYVMVGKLYKISRTTVMKDLLKSDE